MKRRVVITGIGAISPNGVGRERFWDATKRGVSGVRRISRFDPAGFQVQIAGEVTRFRRRRLRRAERPSARFPLVPLGHAAVKEALADAGIEFSRMSRDELRSIGVIVGSGGGSQEFTENNIACITPATRNSAACTRFRLPP